MKQLDTNKLIFANSIMGMGLMQYSIVGEMILSFKNSTFLSHGTSIVPNNIEWEML